MKVHGIPAFYQYVNFLLLLSCNQAYFTTMPTILGLVIFHLESEQVQESQLQACFIYDAYCIEIPVVYY